ncbi:outer membrane protein OmpK [Enterovibrio baiacu]|uniref:outer membrane protein OmpK n=1 Tax=Enterovibrio baiacu TaxID=2491023 RepID=UPI003D14DC16
MRKSVVALAVLASAAAVPAQAEYLYGFGNVYTDYLTWTNGTQGFDGKDVSDMRDDHITIGAEGGAGFTWGEIYGFYEYEKLNKGSDERGQAAKFQIHYKIAGNVTAYGQIYDLVDNKFGGEQNRVLGLGYVGLTGDNYWFKPWVGVHDASREGQSGASGMNGGMLGWSAGYSFEIAGEPLQLVNWNEVEFARSDEYQAHVGTKSSGLNGAVVLSYDITDTVYTSVTYRYFSNKLGVDGYGDAAIFRIGMHL